MNLNAPKPCNWPRTTVQQFAADAAERLDYQPGNNIRKTVRDLGGRISETDWSSVNHTGSVEVRGVRDFEIFLSPFSGDRRQRFTIAHELGHYILHSDCGKKPIRVARDGSGRVEWEANWFAAGFLMPAEEMNSLLAKRWSDAELAEHFGVSEQAVGIRRSSL